MNIALYHFHHKIFLRNQHFYHFLKLLEIDYSYNENAADAISDGEAEVNEEDMDGMNEILKQIADEVSGLKLEIQGLKKEFDIIKTHTVIGWEILQSIKELPKLSTGAKWHHEKYDGSGYPDGLSGKDIPEEARIICLADCYDAMTSQRSYSSPRSQVEVRKEIERCMGTHFDPDIAKYMLEMIDDDKEYRLRE